MKGIIIEKHRDYFILLTSTNEYKKVKGRTGQRIGEEITIIKHRNIYPYIAAAAVFLMMLMVCDVFSPTLAPPQVFAYITLDINPSVEFSVDGDKRVIEAVPFNSDGEVVLKESDYKGKKIGEALAAFTRQAIRMGYISSQKDNQILISWVNESSSRGEELESELQQIKESQKALLQEEKQEASIAAVILDDQIRQAAKKVGVTAGKFEAVKRMGEETIIEESTRDEKIGDLLKKKQMNFDDVFPEAKKLQELEEDEDLSPSSKVPQNNKKSENKKDAHQGKKEEKKAESQKTEEKKPKSEEANQKKGEQEKFKSEKAQQKKLELKKPDNMEKKESNQGKRPNILDKSKEKESKGKGGEKGKKEKN